MGSWSPKSFDNDTAQDAVEELLQCTGYQLVHIWFKECLDAYEQGETIDLDLCCNAIVGAEVMAALQGNPSEDFPNRLKRWIKKYQPVEFERLNNIGNFSLFYATEHPRSELKQLWKEQGDALWQTEIKNLKRRTDYINSGVKSGWLSKPDSGKIVLKMLVKE